MPIWLAIFVISCFLVFYNYAGYAILVYLVNKLTGASKGHVSQESGDFPSISFIVAAYNEEDYMEKKIKNSLEQDYPKGKIEFIFVTDGSSDRTPDIIGLYPSIQLLHQPERRGKSAALDRAVHTAKNDILIVSDANTLLNPNAVKNIARHYRDEKVGGVAGEKKVISLAGKNDEVGGGEGLYWKYESYLKKLDSTFYSVVGAAGELFSLRRKLYEPLPSKVILDDFVISLKIAQKGYRVMYEPDAFAMELPSFSLKDEQKRKIRIAAGGFQAIGMLGPLFAFWRYPRLSFLYISHRVMRWTTSPLCMILAFISNGFLVARGESYLLTAAFLAQLTFYGTAFMAWLLPSLSARSKLAKLSYYFVFMNISVIQGFLRFVKGTQSATWEKARRAQQDLRPE